MTIIDRDGDSQDLTSFLHKQIKGAFATEVESLKIELRRERDSQAMGMRSELSRIETPKSKITQFDVLVSDEPAVLGTGKIICTTLTHSKHTCVVRQAKIGLKFPGDQRRFECRFGPYYPLGRSHQFSYAPHLL